MEIELREGETGPIYDIPLIKSMPLSGGSMRQAMPSRDDLKEVTKRNSRVSAGYEVLLAHYLNLKDAYDRSGLDISCCSDCQAEVICIPDGMPLCQPCAEKNQ